MDSFRLYEKAHGDRPWAPTTNTLPISLYLVFVPFVSFAVLFFFVLVSLLFVLV